MVLGDAQLLLLPAPPVPAMERMPLRQTRMRGEIIKFDTWSHSSGERRACIICNVLGHAASYGTCSKYRQVSAFKSEKEC
eukprot:2914641-Alexandrium_andersonii.AAC.1